jgi:hypothetical protein
MFTTAGSIMCKIDDVKFAEPKFAKGPSDFDICIHGTSVDDPNQGDYWRGEMSQNYGKGNFAAEMQGQITMKTLRKLGFEGDDLTTLAEQLKDKTVPFHVEASEANDKGKVFYNVKFLELGQAPQEIDMDTVNARLTALFSKEAAPAPAATTAASNPFAKKPTAEKAEKSEPKAAKKTSGVKLPF